ncbi:MAG: hypothetical protein U1E81_07505 [Xanthobacteraceae bacterium]
MVKRSENLEAEKRLMAALGRLPPKQQKDMKLGKHKIKSEASPAKKRDRAGVSAKPKTA